MRTGCPQPPGEGRNPVVYVIHSRVSGNDNQAELALISHPGPPSWIPAFAGMMTDVLWNQSGISSKVQDAAIFVATPAVIYGQDIRSRPAKVGIQEEDTGVLVEFWLCLPVPSWLERRVQLSFPLARECIIKTTGFRLSPE